jgi:hypothetical protein
MDEPASSGGSGRLLRTICRWRSVSVGSRGTLRAPVRRTRGYAHARHILPHNTPARNGHVRAAGRSGTLDGGRI